MRRGTSPGGPAPCGGSGSAWEAVRAEVTAWLGVSLRRRFGRDGLFVRHRLFACGPAGGDER